MANSKNVTKLLIKDESHRVRMECAGVSIRREYGGMEYIVRLKSNKEADYFTDDAQDAADTAIAMMWEELNRMAAEQENAA